MTLREFNSAKKQGENFVVPVVSHKTGHIAPAMIVFNNALHRSTVDYIEIVRKKIPYVDERDETLVFVTYGGAKMGSSLACSQLCSFWNQSQGSKGRIINSTTIRKFTTTKVHSQVPELKKDTANHLCYSLETAEENYFFTDLRTRAGGTSSKIQEIQRRKPREIEEVFKEDLENGYIDTVIVRKKLKSNFPLDVFDKKKEKAILDSLTYKIKKSGINEINYTGNNQLHC